VADLIPHSRKIAFRTLLDDPSPTVRQALIQSLQDYGSSGVDFLKELKTSGDQELSEHSQNILQILQKDTPEMMFTQFIRSLQYDLESGFFLLSKIDKPDLDVSEYMGRLEDIADRCKTLFIHPMTDRERCRVLNRVIFHEHGFVGNRQDFDNPSNTFIHSLFATHRGIPISLSILYLLVALRCDLKLDPIAFPGRFMVGSFSEEEPFFIDPFEGGAFKSVDYILNFLNQHDLEVHLEHFAPCPIGEVLCRCCRNLHHQYALHKQQDKAELYQQFVHEFEATFERKPSY